MCNLNNSLDSRINLKKTFWSDILPHVIKHLWPRDNLINSKINPLRIKCSLCQFYNALKNKPVKNAKELGWSHRSLKSVKAQILEPCSSLKTCALENQFMTCAWLFSKTLCMEVHYRELKNLVQELERHSPKLKAIYCFAIVLFIQKLYS